MTSAQEQALAAANITAIQAESIRKLVDIGFPRARVVEAVVANDISKLDPKEL
jgi:hypothetical protein